MKEKCQPHFSCHLKTLSVWFPWFPLDVRCPSPSVFGIYASHCSQCVPILPPHSMPRFAPGSLSPSGGQKDPRPQEGRAGTARPCLWHSCDPGAPAAGPCHWLRSAQLLHLAKGSLCPTGHCHPPGITQKGPRVWGCVSPCDMLLTHPAAAEPSSQCRLSRDHSHATRAFCAQIHDYKARAKGHTGSRGSFCKAKSLRFDESSCEEPLKAARKHRIRQRNSFDIRTVKRCQFVQPNPSLCDSTWISVFLAACF